jgi:hypothetical protein
MSRIVDIYASGDLPRETYVAKNLAYDAEAAKLRMQVAELNSRIPLLRKRSVVQASITAFCQSAEARLNACTDFDSKRQFLLEYIDKIVYRAGTVSLHGAVPIKLAPHEHPHQQRLTSRLPKTQPHLQLLIPELGAAIHTTAKAPHCPMICRNQGQVHWW